MRKIEGLKKLLYTNSQENELLAILNDDFNQISQLETNIKLKLNAIYLDNISKGSNGKSY